ncbi:isopentenyl-diphosphate Delta-isomerase [Actinocatenispora sera]|jgi:isopentenyl-diphosphate delta-isomerase|uniref:isopentenyl-diphosphate Delta-isomerase n=1 Tax=Actinocatenispora sera TaxID=390989 RepID=A0A810KZQ5_9ACTN|nr:isopentenyl-diphosphate Delta-isomerase [Actinocatenispora sera]BCJ27488.1 isopentenyl-diphosphate Delta-isomerase [Actinocatenispora sera]
MPENREVHPVELVDAAGRGIGTCTVAEAHTLPGRHHRAYSVLLAGPDGVLLQRRAASKTRFPLRWSNTCCGHPAPNGDLAASAAQRLAEEMGVTGVELREVGEFDYRAEDAATNRVEDEHDHVLVGYVDGATPDPDPAEVGQWRWVSLPELRSAVEADPDSYTPWLPGVLRLAEPAVLKS